MQTGMAKGHCEHLIKLFRKCLDGKGTFTFSDYLDMETAWDHAAAQLTPISKIHIQVWLLTLIYRN